MYKLIKIIIPVLFLVSFELAYAQQKYKPEWESLRQHVPVPEWMRDAKFGIYCHWGVYSVPAYNNEQYYKFMHQDETYDKMGTYRRHVALFGPLTHFGYHDFIPMFKAEKFNADEWAWLFRKSGARFAGTVGEHHDGFSMWDSQFTPFNVKNMGPKRDVLGELEIAIRKQGMKFFVSLHHEINYTYVKVKPEWAASKPEYAKMYGCMMPHEEWLKMWQDKCNEVVDKYHPDIIYFDAWMDQIPEPYKCNFLQHYFNDASSRNQEVIVTYKNKDFPREIGMLDHEVSSPNHLDSLPWLCDYTIGSGYHYSWGYVEGMILRSPKEIVHKLVEVVSNNGQLLLNMSPMADGTFPQNQKDVVANVGVWLWSYGESIYETRPFTVSMEITKENQKVHYTTKGKTIYAIFLEWPITGQALTLTQLKAGNTTSKIKGVTVLGLKEPATCQFKQSANGLDLTIPKGTRMPSDLAQVIKIELE